MTLSISAANPFYCLYSVQIIIILINFDYKLIIDISDVVIEKRLYEEVTSGSTIIRIQNSLPSITSLSPNPREKGLESIRKGTP